MWQKSAANQITCATVSIIKELYHNNSLVLYDGSNDFGVRYRLYPNIPIIHKENVLCLSICRGIDIERSSGVGTGSIGVIAPPHFCKDGARDFHKFDEKISWRRG